MNLVNENKLFKEGLNSLISVDEAGRGPLAGPVVAACILVNSGYRIKNKKLLEVKDSKLLSAKKRNELHEVITNEFRYGIGVCDNLLIDKLNIHHASIMAMEISIKNLDADAELILIDGIFKIPEIKIRQQTIVGGDRKIFSIAAASIIAKVERDRLMEEYHQAYPEYGFDQHKGYGTRSHLEKIRSLGASPIHRRSFSPLKAS